VAKLGKIIVGMTMSLDGFVNDSHGSVAKLYSDFEALRDSPILQESIKNTGAVVMGRHAFEMADMDSYADTYEYQVPIFVVTHEAPQKHPRENDKLTFTFVTDGIDNAVEKASAAAGDKYVTIVGGASIIQQCLRTGLADELHIDIMPVLLGSGLRLFEHISAEPLELEKIDIQETASRILIRFRVVK
jgi:dihydrofolate reductase